MGYVFPWFLLMAYQVYTKGIQKNKLPEPYYFILPSGAIGIAAVIGMKNNTLGIAIAWAILIAVAISNEVNRGNQSQNTTATTGVVTT